MTDKKPQNNLDELWDEIPGFAFIALGRRGREQINLHQCFVPNCNENEESKLHIVKQENEEPTDSNTTEKVKRIKYHVQCDSCKQAFQLVFERFLEEKQPSDTDGEEEEESNQIVFENVYATDETGHTNYGQIGFVQPR